MVATRFFDSFNKDKFEKEAWSTQLLVCGLDEVGRGPLFGPVVAAAVILPGRSHRCLKDSKVMSPAERLKAFDWIQKNCWTATAIIHNRKIDAVNIYQATLQALRRAFMQLMIRHQVPVSTILVDAMPLSLENTSHEKINLFYFPFGEKKSSSIAAASIVAKVTRDALIVRLDSTFPDYFLAQHKGYATSLHYQQLVKKGAGILHRTSFLKKLSLAVDEEIFQQTLGVLDHEQSFC